MPRKRRVPGHPGRPDLGAQPVQVPTGLPYGQAGKLAAAQAEVPLAQAPEPVADPVAVARDMPFPVGMQLNAPTARPAQPITAGLPGGPGPGPEILRPHVETTSSRLARLAEELDDDFYGVLARRAAQLGI